MGNLITSSGFEKAFQYADRFKEGLIVTVLLALFTVIFGFILGIILAIARMSDFRPFRFLSLDKNGRLRSKGFLLTLSKFNPISFLASCYVEIIRSTPVLVQIMIIYFGLFNKDMIVLPKMMLFGFIRFERFVPGVVALSMNSGAYLCEIIRSGIQSIDGGQSEAARSLGLSATKTMLHIILPQALRNILPAIANEFVVIIKESAIAYTIGVPDIMAAVNDVRAATFTIMEPLLIATAIYFSLCFPTSKLIAYIERRMSRGNVR